MNDTAAGDKERRPFFGGSVPLAGVTRFSAECLFGSDRWAGVYLTPTKSAKAGPVVAEYVGDGPSDGPYPGMFIQRCLN